MDEQAQNLPTQQPAPQPQVVTAPLPTTEVPGKKNKVTLSVIIGIVVLLIGFVIVLVLLNSSSEESEVPVVQTTGSTEVKNTEDLDKISEELDTADLDSYETDLGLNDSDSAGF